MKLKEKYKIEGCYVGLCNGLTLNGIPKTPEVAREVGEELTRNMAYFKSELIKANAEIDRLRGMAWWKHIIERFKPRREG